MLLQNVLYSTIDLYITKINQYLSDGYVISADFKTYDKEKDDFVVFKCFDIKSSVETNNNFIISEIKYLGYLEFTYSKVTNEVFISKLPYLVDGKVEFPIFTNDIAQIVVDKVKFYISNEDIKLTFSNPVGVFAIDNKVKEVIPSFCETKNCNIISHIIDTIALEEKRIRKHILNLKVQKDREDRAIERAVSKKRKIYGIDSSDYENQQEFYNVVNKKICEVYSRKIQKIERHLELNERKYKEMLKDVKIFMPVGGSFDVISKSKKRAPQWMIKRKLEWLYRLFQEPKRVLRQTKIIKYVIYIIMKKEMLLHYL